MKRLLVRLSLISVLVASGVFAIVQSQREKTQDPNGPTQEAAPPLSPQVPLLKPPALAASDDSSAELGALRTAGSQLIPIPKQFDDSSREGSFVLPAPTAAIMRGNNGDDNATLAQTGAFSEATVEDDAAPPPANHLAQAGAPSQSRNPFARRAYETTGGASSNAISSAGASGLPANASSGVATNEGEYSPAGPPLASPSLTSGSATGGSATGAAESNSEYAPATSRIANATGDAAATDTNSFGGYRPASSDPTEAIDSNTAAPLGEPREFAPAGDTTAQEPRAIGISSRPATAIELPAEEPNSIPTYQGGQAGGASVSISSSPYGAPSSLPGGVEGSGTPGPQNLEGAQTPSITLKKIAPPEIQVGKPASFEIQVQNVGRIAAHQVIVKEEIPRGVRLIDTAPPASPQSGALVWELGALQPGESRQIKIQYLPFAEGDIGSIAVAAFQVQSSVRTVCTRPQLTIEQTAPEKVLVGQAFTVRIRLSNPGTGVATKVVLEEDVPDGFIHPSGRALEYEVGSLRPGETRDLDLTLQAAKPGVWDNALVVRAEGNLAVEKSAKIEIVAPQLEVAMTGPTRRYLERQATYTVAIANPGTATANDVQLVGRLPKGMKFVAATNEGAYDPKTHAVVWALAELPPGQVGQVQLTALPVETGEQKILVEGKGSLDTTAQAEHAVSVEALAELAFEIADKADPIEVNKETVYEVKVTNRGSKTATSIRVTAVFPPDMKPLAGDGPARAEVADGRVIFEPLARLNPREEATFRIQAEGLRAGDQRIQVQVVSDDSPTPVTKEESTRVYSDR